MTPLRSPSPRRGRGDVVGSAGGPPQPARGWYRDPWRRSAWRWWDGLAWTHHESDRAHRRPRLGSWLSWPIALAGLATGAGLFGLLVVSTESAVQGMLLGLVPLFVVLPVLTWLDRLEPEPFRSRLHAVLWGATVAGFVSGVVNSGVAYFFGEAWAAVASAPLIEEATKGLGIVMALRRREIDGPALNRMLVVHPWMTAKVAGAIYWQALKLWFKRTPFYDHPASDGDYTDTLSKLKTKL